MRVFLVLLLSVAVLGADLVLPRIPADASRPFVSGDVWTVPMEDWRLEAGKIENTHSGGDRKIVSLTSEVVGNGKDFEISVVVDQLSKALESEGFVGFQVGLQGRMEDFRDSAIYGAGLSLGVLPDGRLFVGNPEDAAPGVRLPLKNVTLELVGTFTRAQTYALTLRAKAADGKVLATYAAEDVHPSWVTGLVALVSSTRPPQTIERRAGRLETVIGGAHFGRMRSSPSELAPIDQARGGEARFRFSEWTLSGGAVKHHPERAYGPIWWSTYTVDEEGVLRLLVQLAPVVDSGPGVSAKRVQLELAGRTHVAEVETAGYTALFKIPLAEVSADLPYTVRLDDQGRIEEWEGIVRAVPTGEQAVVVASLSCNDSTGFPHNELVANVTAHDPDLIAFLGDQLYERIGGYENLVDQAPNLRANVSYLRKFAMHGWSWRELLATRPSITIPDDHDVMHGNIWGAGGKAADMSGDLFQAQDSGGYKMSSEFVNMVHRTQTGNLPTADDQPTCQQGISTYHSNWRYGPLDLIVLADRQFKTAPRDVFPEAKIRNGWPQNLAWDAKTQSRRPGLELLGPMQEAFLEKWADAPHPEAPFRLVLSQTPWLAPQTLPVDMHSDAGVPGLPIYPQGGYAPNDEPKADFDTNSWPQDKQKRALRLMKKAGALHLTGDQHLGTTGQYGLDTYDDGPWWITSPAIANVWPRRWMPQVAAANAEPGWPRWKGGFEDGFGNRFTMHAVANPIDQAREPARLFDRAVGYSITTYDLKRRTISLANWAYTSGPQKAGEDGKPYDGWPIELPLE